MSRQYAFWWKADGKLSRDDKYAPVESLAEIGRSAEFDGETNRIVWRNVGVRNLQLPIKTALCIIGPDGRELNEFDTARIGQKATNGIIKKDGGGKPVAARRLIDEVDHVSAQFFREREEAFVLISSLSVEHFPAKRISTLGCNLSPATRRDIKRFPVPDVIRRQALGTRYEKHLKESRYLPIKVSLKARTPASAFHIGVDAINLNVGLWNLAYPSGTSLFTAMGHERPLGAILVGPIHTVHPVNGTAGDLPWWYEPTFIADQRLFVPRNGWSKAERFRRWAMAKIRTSSLKNDLESLLARYAEAVAQPNHSISFLQLWSILEKITGTIGARYEETVRRAVWIYTDRKLAAEAVEALRTQRNQFVHAAKSRDGGYEVAATTRNIVNDHLMWLLRNTLKVGSLTEYAEYLSLSSDLTSLRLKRRRLSHAIALARRRADNTTSG